MKMWPIVLGPVIFLVARCAWSSRHRVLGLTRSGFSWLAARIGVAVHIVLKSVLAEGALVLIGFRPDTASRHAPPDLLELGLDYMLLSPDSGAETTIALLRRWEATGATIVMWGDQIVGQIQLSHFRTGQQVTLSVIGNPVVKIGTDQPSR